MRVRDWINELKNLCIRQDEQSKAESQELTRTVTNYAWIHLSPNKDKGNTISRGNLWLQLLAFTKGSG